MTERADESTAMTEEADGEELPLTEQLAAEQARAAELRENWQRERADFINYRRRVESERADLIPLANAALLTKILPVLDDFDLALANIPAKTKATTWVDGVMLIQRKLLKLLEGEGVTPIEALGQSFDPRLHEAVVRGRRRQGAARRRRRAAPRLQAARQGAPPDARARRQPDEAMSNEQ